MIPSIGADVVGWVELCSLQPQFSNGFLPDLALAKPNVSGAAKSDVFEQALVCWVSLR